MKTITPRQFSHRYTQVFKYLILKSFFVWWVETHRTAKMVGRAIAKPTLHLLLGYLCITMSASSWGSLLK
jgi:hypothetical protein